MATLDDLIARALRTSGRLDIGETPTANEKAAGLVVANHILQQWATEKLLTYAKVEITHTLTVGDGEYTIGSGGDINTTRPLKIDYALVIDGDIDYPLDVYQTEAGWQDLVYKPAEGLPDTLWYRPEFTSARGKIFIYPVPDVAYTLKMFAWQQFTAFAATTDTVTFPPGYEVALMWELAKQLAPEAGMPPPAHVVQMAASTKAQLKAINYQPIIPPNPLTHSRRHDIFSG